MSVSERKHPIRLGLLISGGGRSLQNLIDRIDSGELKAEIVLVISSSAAAKGVEKARAAGIHCEIVERKDYLLDEEFAAVVARFLQEAGVELVVLAGFLKLWRVPEGFEGRAINIHPALIPDHPDHPDHCGKGMYGIRVHESVIRSGDSMSGCTVHFVDTEYDHGPVILQRLTAVQPDEGPQSLGSRVFELECEALPEAIRMIAQGEVWLEGDKAVFRKEK